PSHLPSFPPRRSSDLGQPTRVAQFAQRLLRHVADKIAHVQTRIAEAIQIKINQVNPRTNIALSPHRPPSPIPTLPREGGVGGERSEEHTSELQSRFDL